MTAGVRFTVEQVLLDTRHQETRQLITYHRTPIG